MHKWHNTENLYSPGLSVYVGSLYVACAHKTCTDSQIQWGHSKIVFGESVTTILKSSAEYKADYKDALSTPSDHMQQIVQYLK